MREILFRGKRVDNGEWVEGCYSHEKVGDYFTAVFITEPLTDGVFARHRVDPSTVGLIPPPPVSARTATQILIFFDVTVIGNIHDNPELLKQGDADGV